ncbi:hypothetical protein KMP13_10205 [Epibacterium ulvae]|uniref:hypothetical protein n=1 Tax=Epibacterium ulvae TaxID=1156985 RepID=UPI001BFCAC8C|nr:hypothetical protein [Epibacterium ulvae]MBT8154263.1 hypothetical protein [Epibacterium ulvae]
MNRLFTLSASLLLAANTAAASCPREDFRDLWNVFFADYVFDKKNISAAEKDAFAKGLTESLAQVGALSISPEGATEYLVTGPLRDEAPFVTEVFIDQSCALYTGQPVADLVQFLQTPTGQEIMDTHQDDERLTAIFEDLFSQPSPYDASWYELFSFFATIEELGASIKARFQSDWPPFGMQITYEDRLADMFERRDIVTFKSEKHRELAVKLLRITADVKQLNGTQ